MHYRRYIDQACSHLQKLGINPEIRDGELVTDTQLSDIEAESNISLPSELRTYLLEMGDGFQLWYSAEPVTSDGENQFSWSIDFIEDIIDDYECIRDDMGSYADGDGEFCNTDECKNEARRRMNWVPVFGIGGGGYTFCIDTGEGNGEIRFHDIRMSDGYFPSIHLAKSIDDWMHRWSSFCFSQPLSDGTDQHTFLESYCWELDGTFDWSPQKFRTEFHRAPER